MTQRPAANGPQSPKWSPQNKRIVAVALLILLLLGLYVIRGLLIPLILAVVIAYVVEPIVQLLMRYRLSRGLAIALVYVVILAGLIAIPVSTIPQLIAQADNLISNTPRYLQQLGDFLSRPIQVGDFEIPLDELPIEQAYESLSQNLVSIVQTVGSRSFTIFGSVASATLSTLGWTIIILVLSLYMVKDYRQLWGSMVGMVPPAYQADIYRLGSEIGATWNAFLRGQLILGLIIGVITFTAAFIVGLPNALILALIAGLFEFIPNIGPVLAAIPAVLIALFQNDASWLGAGMSPLFYAAIVLGIYVIIQQVENIILVPRIIGRSLNLHPLLVFFGALVGASVAGVLGILLAAPLLATGRLIFLYIYRKLRDLPPFPGTPTPTTTAQTAVAEEPTSLIVTEP